MCTYTVGCKYNEVATPLICIFLQVALPDRCGTEWGFDTEPPVEVVRGTGAATAVLQTLEHRTSVGRFALPRPTAVYRCLDLCQVELQPARQRPAAPWIAGPLQLAQAIHDEAHPV